MKIDDVLGANEGISRDDLSAAIIQRMMATGAAAKLLRTHGLDAVIAAVDDIADFHAGAAELGSSDLSIMVNQVMKNLGSSVAEDSKDDPNHPDTEVANSNPAQAPQGNNPAQVGNAPQAGKMAPTTGTPAGQSNTAAGAAYDAQQNIAGNSTGATAAAQQAAAGAKETTPVLPSDRTAAQQAKLVKAKVQTGALPLSSMSETRVSNEPVIGDIMILELADGRAIHAPIAELRGNSLILALDETAHQWLDEAPDHEHLKIQSSSKISPIAMTWNSLVDELESDTPEGWAALFRNRALDRESPRQWGRIWRQQHVHLGDELGLDDQRAWEDAVTSKLDEMGDSLGEQEDIVRKRLDPKDPAMLAVWMKSHSGVKGKTVSKFSQEIAKKAGHSKDTYWDKIKNLVTETDAHEILWPIITRVLGRKLYTGKNAADIYSHHTPDGIEIHGAVTRNLKGNEALELEQALHAAGIPIKKVTIEPDMIRVSLRGEIDEATFNVLGMNENTSDPYAKERRYYIVKKDSPVSAIPGISEFHTKGAAKQHLITMKDQDQYIIRAIDTHRLLQQELDEGIVDILKILALLGLSAYGIGSAMDSISSPAKTPLGQALSAAAGKGDKSAAKYLQNLNAYIEANDVNTLDMLKDSYLDGPNAAVKEAWWSREDWSPAMYNKNERRLADRFGHDAEVLEPEDKASVNRAQQPRVTDALDRHMIMQLRKNLDAVTAQPLQFKNGDRLEISINMAANALKKLLQLKPIQRLQTGDRIARSEQDFADFMGQDGINEAKYHGKTVKLGKPIRTNTGEGGKFKVYVRDPKTGNIKMVRFGDTTGLSIKRDDPKRRKSYRARHHCENPGPRTKANYWSCRMWTAKPVGKILKGK